MYLTVKIKMFMDENCLMRNLKLIIASILLFFSGWIIGCGVGEIFGNNCLGAKIGVGLSLLVIGIVVLKIYLMDREYKNLKNLYKKD